MDEKVHGQPDQAKPPVTPILEITKGDDKGKTFELTELTRLGREVDNDVVLIDPRISRHHAKIESKAGVYTITDLGSSNKTYVNGVAVEDATTLKSGDRITLGEIELVYRDKSHHREDTLGVKAQPKPVRPAVTAAPTAQPQESGPSRLVMIAGAFILFLCVAAAIALLMISRLSSNDEGGPAAQVTGDVQSASPAGQSSTGAQVEDGPVSDPTNLSLVYEDDFSDPFGGWDDAFDAYTTKQYGNNRYQIEVSTSNLVAWGLANRDVADFSLEVEARQEGGGEANSYGLLFRFQDRDNFYRFDITGDGFFLVSKFVDGNWSTLVDWTAAPSITQETNLIGVSAFGPELTFKVNGQQIATVTDDSLTHGNFGFFASTFNDPYMWVSYDNLKLEVPEGQEIALLPTPTRVIVPLSAAESEAAPVEEEAEPTVEVVETEEATVEAEAEEATPTATPEATATPEPTATPVPLPEYASRDQLLARGEAAVTGRIIFPVFDPERGSYDIYMADAADGGNRELVQANASQPAFNADGTEIAYRSWQGNTRGLFAQSLSEDDDPWNFDNFFESARPQFSPTDGSLIYFSRTGGKEPALYQVVDGKGQVMRRDGAPIQGQSPKWGPNGQQYVYSSCIGGKCGIILANIDGSFTLLTDHPSDINPEISPDGSTIVFMSERSGDWEIYQIDIDGQNLIALTSDDASDGLPTWSPDGSKIAFVANRDGDWGIWDMDPGGGNQRRLFDLGGPVDGIVQLDTTNSRGWLEENIDWAP